MSEPYRLPEILAALEARSGEVVAALRAIEPAAFMAGSTESWGPAQHATHLAYIHARVARALATPDRLPEATTTPRGYSAIREQYRAALAQAPPALLSANSSNGEPGAGSTPDDIIGRYTAAAADSRAALARWEDAALDARAIPHPLLGPLPVRDMMLFMLYHDQHHLDGITRRR